MAQAQYIAASVTTTGQVNAPLGAPGGAPFATYALQIKGVGGAPTSWTATLDGSLDGQNWTVLITHNATDGLTMFETTGKPNLFFRVNVSALTLGGSATALAVKAIAVP